jgi:hypothetical protein
LSGSVVPAGVGGTRGVRFHRPVRRCAPPQADRSDHRRHQLLGRRCLDRRRRGDGKVCCARLGRHHDRLRGDGADGCHRRTQPAWLVNEAYNEGWLVAPDEKPVRKVRHRRHKK